MSNYPLEVDEEVGEEVGEVVGEEVGDHTCSTTHLISCKNYLTTKTWESHMAAVMKVVGMYLVYLP